MHENYDFGSEQLLMGQIEFDIRRLQSIHALDKFSLIICCMSDAEIYRIAIIDICKERCVIFYV
jgi:hypothetical protein